MRQDEMIQLIRLNIDNNFCEILWNQIEIKMKEEYVSEEREAQYEGVIQEEENWVGENQEGKKYSATSDVLNQQKTKEKYLEFNKLSLCGVSSKKSSKQVDEDQNNKNIHQKKRLYFNRSSNNSHKKYSSMAKNNLFKFISKSSQHQILQKFKPYKSSRIYFFCFLISVKIHLKTKQFKKFVQGFIADIKDKINKFSNEILNTSFEELKRFRSEEVIDIKMALISFKIFFSKSIQQGIQCLYKQSKGQLLKLHEFRKNYQIIQQIASRSKLKLYDFDIESFIEDEIEKNFKNSEIILPEQPKFIEALIKNNQIFQHHKYEHNKEYSSVKQDVQKQQVKGESVKRISITKIEDANNHEYVSIGNRVVECGYFKGYFNNPNACIFQPGSYGYQNSFIGFSFPSFTNFSTFSSVQDFEGFPHPNNHSQQYNFGNMHYQN